MSDKIISKSRLRTLLLRDEILRRLEEGGVDKWKDFAYSLNLGYDLRDWSKETLPALLDDFEDA